jgi:hypothetical protein
MEIELVNVRQLIQECWEFAEAQTISLVAARHLCPKEESITFLLAGGLREAIKAASEARRVEMAFLADLRRVVHSTDFELRTWSNGLIARVSFHNHQHEGRVSGADLGLVLVRPLVHLGSAGTRIEFSRDHVRGLLAQAKRGLETKSKNGRRKWGRFTLRQMRRYPECSDYYSLLLYRLNGESASELQPIKWQICKEYALDEVRGWFRSDSFPEELSNL